MSYFLRTVKEGSKVRLRPLPHQRLSDGTVINHNYNVQGSSSIRDEYPVGSLFYTETLSTRSHAATLFYSAGTVCHVNTFLKEYADYEKLVEHIQDVLRKAEKGIVCLENSLGERKLLTAKDPKGQDRYIMGYLSLYNLKDNVWMMIPDSEEGIGTMRIVNYGKVG